ncbi:MAG: cyclic nucleotide-binding domain-containing protein [Burkholderiales bacterium]|nr:cyclic nucleotide-binding domain-containing protein [Burkholderiales bacterium]
MSSFLDSLDPEARELLLAVSTPVSFTVGSTLVRHGEPARGAYVLREGAVEANVTLPGGESLTVAKLGAGSVFGEMSLVELGTCTATVRATAAVDGWFVASEDFRALVSRRQPAAARLQHALTLILAEKLAALNAQLQGCTAPEDRPAREAAARDPLAGVPRTRVAPFDASGFLPRLPFFERFSEDEIDELVSHASYVEVPRGNAIFTPQGAAASAFIVVRGAAEIVTVRDACERRVAVLGPGQLIGYSAVLRRGAHNSFAYARESALLLDIPARAFHEIYFGESRTSTRLRSAVQKSLLGSMARTNRALTRLLSQAKLEAATREGRKLEAALHGQLTTAG